MDRVYLMINNSIFSAEEIQLAISFKKCHNEKSGDLEGHYFIIMTNQFIILIILTSNFFTGSVNFLVENIQKYVTVTEVNNTGSLFQVTTWLISNFK
jgi:hypothetical protein